MRYHALALDYDGTLATEGVVDDATVGALERLRASGRKLLLVTGRELDDLQRVFPRIDLFDRVVAENGALVFRPSSKDERALCDPPSARFIDALRERNVSPLSIGRVIVATWHPNEEIVLDCIREQGLELHVIFNKGAVMVLPAGVNKASGLAVALEELGLSRHNVVAVGDAENDHAFLAACEVSVAVENALPSVKETADIVSRGARGAGVAEVIDRLLHDDLVSLDLERHHTLLGTDAAGDPVRVAAHRETLLVSGPSGSGKSTLVTGLIERAVADDYQVLVVDPEGDYELLDGAIAMGGPHAEPDPDHVVRALEEGSPLVVMNLLGVRLEDRPAACARLLPRISELRARSGRPHLIVIDEAHHMLAESVDLAPDAIPRHLDGVILITIHPDRLRQEILQPVTVVATTGEVDEIAAAVAREKPVDDVPSGQVLLWPLDGDARLFRVAPSNAERLRHIRKYAEGELAADRSFYFRGPQGKLNLRAQNLTQFLQLAEGVDEETFEFHRRSGHFSGWIHECVKDPDLAKEVRAVEEDGSDAGGARAELRRAIEARYTAPA